MGARGNVMKSNSLINEITEMINSHGKGTIFSIHDFYHLGTKNSVKSSLLRLEKKGEIERLVDGMYVIPKYSEILNELSYPSVDDLANKIAEKFSWIICPSEENALNMLGLSTQIPNEYIYLSNGPYRVYEYRGRKIKYKHSSNRYITDYSSNLSLIIQAIKSLGKNNINESVIGKIATFAYNNIDEDLTKDTKKLPHWIFNSLVQINEKVKEYGTIHKVE